MYRYYCRNPQCTRGSFTNLPPGLAPYSHYRMEVRRLARQMYPWGYSTHRRTSAALGVASLKTWSWVSAWGETLLPVVALFGRVTSRKHDLAPANDRGPPCPNSVTLTRGVFRLRRKCAIILRNDRG